MIPPRYQLPLICAFWLLACLALTGPGLYLLSQFGAGQELLLMPEGRLATSVAAHYTSAPSAISAGSDRIELTARLLFWSHLTATLLYIALTFLHHSAWVQRGARRRHALFALQMLIILYSEDSLAYVFAAQIGVLPQWRTAASWFSATILGSAAVKLLMVAVPLSGTDQRFSIFFMIVGSEVLVQAMVAGMVHVGLRERRGRIALALANAELQATQALLGEAVRASERLRIARDLHDVAGHHLTALKLHLDLATRQAGAHAPASLATASELASSLLAEVRVLVSTERDERHIDLTGALTALCAGVPSLRIALSIDPQLAIDSAAVAHAVFCAVQEAISNAMRHAQASSMSIALRRGENGEVAIDIEDNGRGSHGVEGNGLRGMRERLAQVGGKLIAANGHGGGFTLSLRLPASGVAA